MLRWIGNRESSGVVAVDGDADAGALRRLGVQHGVGRAGQGSGINHEGGVADGNAFSVDDTLNSLPWHIGEVGGLREL